MRLSHREAREIRTERVGLKWSLASRASYTLWRRNFTGGSLARVRAFWHQVICRYDSEICGECGRRVDPVWWADDELWLKVMDNGGGLLCLRCFDSALDEQGIALRWSPVVIRDDTKEPTR